MADARFDRARFGAGLATRRLGRTLLVRESAASTNDDAWAALAEGLPDGVAVVADAQTRGRGRAGRAWVHAPGLGLALSVGLHLGCDVRQAGVVPLVAGLAVAEALAGLGIAARLKWPNDVLVDGRKVAGVLCELRRLPAGADAVVIGIGVNVAQAATDFPPELREGATSVAEWVPGVRPEDVAAATLNALEPRWTQLQEGDRAALLEAWSARAAFWGEPVAVRTPAGDVHGVARRLDPDGGLVLRLESGIETTVLAGDVSPGAGAEAR